MLPRASWRRTPGAVNLPEVRRLSGAGSRRRSPGIGTAATGRIIGEDDYTAMSPG
jgi:hypothetical protein